MQQAPRVEPHAGVWQLVSTVSGRLREGIDDGALLRASFPPASVTGAPKIQAMKVIAALEATRREVYTGAIGIASPLAGLDLSVAIRSFEVIGERIWLGAGGAVVVRLGPRARAGRGVRQGGRSDRGDRWLAGALRTLAAAARAGGARLARALEHGERPDPGHGVFETVLVEHGRPVRLERHLDRLAVSVRTL